MSLRDDRQDRPRDAEIEREQAHLERAHDALSAMRHRAVALLEELRAGGTPDLDYEAALARRVAALSESRRPLLFGRIDERSGTTWHIGRRHVEDEERELVIDWRAPIATAFYQARPSDPLGLARRRQIMVEQRRVVTVADDLFTPGGGGDASATRLRGGDALLAELERARTGEMLDIVATIQAEQDEIIRSPLEGLLVVQGGPGTGKTAVALHRGAFLLYNHPDLARAGVLVLGPSRAFLRYIAQVLPALGEEAVLQLTPADLVPNSRVRAAEPLHAAMIKGDVRMARILASALAMRREALTEAVVLAVRHVSLAFEPDAVNGLVSSIASRKVPYKAGRVALRARLIADARRMARDRGRFEADETWFAAELAKHPGFVALLERIWPATTPAGLVADLLTRADLLARAANGVLSFSEQADLVRPRQTGRVRSAWSMADLALLDEASALVNGTGRTYGHVIVDEAQDLSPMQLRMVARRAPGGSLTVLGDIAQATGAFAYQSWDELVEHLPGAATARREELTVGYRAPGQILDFAARLLAQAAPGVRPPESVRRGRREPTLRTVAASELVEASLDEARLLAAHHGLVGLVVPEGGRFPGFEALSSPGTDVGHIERDGIVFPVTIVPASLSKGLEFDAVVVVEPSAIAGEDVRGLRLLYVALTRPLQALSIVHASALPGALDARG